MPQPPAYTPATNFQQEETNQVAGRSTVRTAMVDAEFNNIATTIAAVLANLALIQRDDGELADGVVELHSLSADVMTLVGSGGFDIRGAWVTATAYAVGDFVTQGGASYVCTIAHTSGVFATDLAANKWSILGPGIDPAANVTLQQNLTVNGNTTLGDAAGDTVTVNAGTLTFVNPVAVSGAVSLTGSFSASDNSAIGQATATNTHLSIGGMISVGAIQVGLAVQPTIGSDGITRGIGVYSRPDTAVAAFTCADVRNFDADNPTLGAGSAITTLTGLHVRDLTRGTTNNFGVRSALSSGVGKFNFYADGSAPSYFAGQVLLNQPSAVTGVLGAHTPGFQINAGGTAASSIFQGIWQNSNAAGPVLYLAKSRGASFPTHGALLSGDVLGQILFLGSDGTDFSTNSAGISVLAAEGFTNTAQGTRIRFDVAGIGAVSPTGQFVMGPLASLTSQVGFGIGAAIGAAPSLLDAMLHIGVTTSTLNGRLARFQAGSTDANPFVLEFYKNRGASIASPTVITTGDDLGQINAYGYVGATGTFVQAAGITFDTEGTVTDSSTGLQGLIRLHSRIVGGSLLSAPLAIDAANVLAMRDGANAMAFRLYNTTDAPLTNHERGGLRWTGNILEFFSEAGGTGTVRNISLNPGTGDIRWNRANIALGGGAAPTLGTIGGTGPAAAAQRNWLRFIESDGTASFIPVWR